MHKEIQVPVQVENISYPQCFLLFSWVSVYLFIVMVQFASTNTLEPAGTSNGHLSIENGEVVGLFYKVAKEHIIFTSDLYMRQFEEGKSYFLCIPFNAISHFDLSAVLS